MRAAVTALRQHHPARIIVAAPVAAAETYRAFEDVADEIVCVQTPKRFRGVGQWYEDFSQTTDGEVRELLERALKFRPAGQQTIN
jgi:predicted phosphoribosyltransferase